MKKLLCTCLFLLLLLPSAVLGESKTAAYKGMSFPTDAEYIDLKDVGVSKNDMKEFIAFAKKFPGLKKVDMFAVAIGQQRIEELQAALPGVEFGMTMIVGGEHKLRTDATAFSTLHGNEYQLHSSKDFSILKYCKNLYALDLGHNSITDLSFLYDLPKLRVLILAKNQLTDISPIASLHDLEYLEIFRNDISDIFPLSGLTHLTDLNITSNRISDLSPLKNIQSLRRLWLRKCHKYDDQQAIIEQQVKGLREALPDTYIDNEFRGTDGGWRNPGHYTVIRRMFESRRYEPFPDVRFTDYAYPYVP